MVAGTSTSTSSTNAVPCTANFVVVLTEIMHDVITFESSGMRHSYSSPGRDLSPRSRWVRCGAVPVLCVGVLLNTSVSLVVACRHRVRVSPHTHHLRCTRPLSVW
jgi:hypothetical protein